ncbi:MAG: DUF3299 domain-containing protein [Granulosicoccus sp.]
MNSRNALVTGITLFSLLFLTTALYAWWPFSSDKEAEQAELLEVWWEDLIPDDFVQPENPFITMSQEAIDKLMDGSDESNAELARLEAEFNIAPVVTELDGKRVKIPAYVTPLEFNGESRMKEFLLVPYVGACIHTPPPPANQIVHATSTDPVEIPDIYDAVWAIGTIRTKTVKSELAESGYQLEVEEIMPYTGP